jgi:hypothetical protein
MILDSLARARAEQLRVHYMTLPAGRHMRTARKVPEKTTRHLAA